VRTHAFIVYRSLTKLNHVLQPGDVKLLV